MTTIEIINILAGIKLRPFSKNDFDAYSGVASNNPMIGESGDYQVVVDGIFVDFENSKTGMTTTVEIFPMYTMKTGGKE